MNKKNTILIVGLLLFTLPVLAIIKDNSDKFGKFLTYEKCSLEIEKLKLCTDNPKIIVNAGEPVKLKLSWVNLSNSERHIRTTPFGYSVLINNEKGEKIIPIFRQQQIEREKQMNSSGNSKTVITDEVIREINRSLNSSGSNPGMYIEPNQSENDEIKLTEKYDYDFTAKGIYYVTISKTVPSLENEQTIEFVLDNIEIEVK